MKTNTRIRTARSEVDDLAQQLPEMVDQVRDSAQQAGKTLQSMSELTLKEMAAGSIGLAAGLLVAGAPRLLVLTAAAPGVLAAGAMVTRPGLRRNLH